MAYYYIKSTGVRTADTAYTTAQTGTFATLGTSNTYATIAIAVTAGASSDDFICISDATETTGSDIVVAGPIAGNAPFTIVSVDDANCDTYSKATTTQGTATDDVLFTGNSTSNGVYYKAGDDISFTGSPVLNNCTLEVAGSGDKLLASVAEVGSITTNNCTLKGVTGAFISPNNGNVIVLNGGSIEGLTTFIVSGGFGNGGGTLIFNGVDVSDTTGYIIADVGAASTDDQIDIRMHGCKINASASFVEETFVRLGQTFVATQCAVTSAEAEYQFHYESFGGYADSQADNGTPGYHRDESTAYESGRKVSVHCVTNSSATKALPFTFDFPTRFAELSATTDILKIYLTSDTTLYDSDVWAEVVYPDATDNHLYKFISTRHTEPLDTNGTELPTDTGSTWKNGASDSTLNKEYYIDIDTSNSSADCVPVIKMHVGASSSIIYFDTTIDVVS